MTFSRISTGLLTNQNQGGGSKKQGIPSSIGLGRFSLNSIKRRSYPIISINEKKCDLTLFVGNLDELNNLYNKIIFTNNSETIPIICINNITDLILDNTNEDFTCAIIIDSSCIPSNYILYRNINLKLSQGDNIYQLKYLFSTENLVGNVIQIGFSKLNAIEKIGTGDGIYNTTDPITIEFTYP
jgi:hypothetical protein